MAPSMVVLLNTPLILLPILLIPNVSPRLDGFLRWTEEVSLADRRSDASSDCFLSPVRLFPLYNRIAVPLQYSVL